MNDVTKRPNVTAATPRGQIQHGETGDKVPGFDPAAAPMETDAEAGADPIAVAAGLDPAPVADADPRQNASSDGDAMRRFDDAPPAPRRGMLTTVLIVLALALLLAAVLLAR